MFRIYTSFIKLYILGSVILFSCHISSSMVFGINYEKRGITFTYLHVKENVINKFQELIFGPESCHTWFPYMSTYLESRVVGGDVAVYGSQPWQVEISRLIDGHYEHHCSGAILTPLFVLTAAHCFKKNMHLTELQVTMGDHHIGIKDEHEIHFEIDKVVIHPKNKGVGYDNDIAIIKLKATENKGIIYGSHIRPACIPNHETPHNPGTNCIVSGWGKTADNSNTDNSKTLKSANVKLLSTQTCKELYQNYSSVNEGMLCAGHWEGGIDSCGGDSGGPLVCNVTNNLLLFGLVSWGEGCAQPNRPGVYVHVQHYIDWIDQTIKELI